MRVLVSLVALILLGLYVVPTPTASARCCAVRPATTAASSADAVLVEADPALRQSEVERSERGRSDLPWFLGVGSAVLVGVFVAADV